MKGKSALPRIQYRKAGAWELSGEFFVSDCSYHAQSGDSNPGYDVGMKKKGCLISKQKQYCLKELDYANPDDLKKITFIKLVF